jgi:hypothetical protein
MDIVIHVIFFDIKPLIVERSKLKDTKILDLNTITILGLETPSP